MTNRQPNNKHKGISFENFVEHKLTENQINISDCAERRYTETYQQNTEIDRLICDRDGAEKAILEIKSGVFHDVNQAQRLVALAQQEDLNLVFATPDGTTDQFSPRVIEELNKGKFETINPSNPKTTGNLAWEDMVTENFSRDDSYSSTRKARNQHRRSNR